jgi:hypothetical protein
VDDFLVDRFLWLAAAWAAFLAILGLARLAARLRRRIEPGPATPDLPSEPPPAVVGMLVNDGRVDPDAPVATLLDLAARRHLEFYQPTNDPDDTIVRVRERAPADLAPYEQRVLDRVIAAADADGTVPLRELADHYAQDGYQWAAQFGREVTADAKARKLLAEGPGGIAVIMVVIGFHLSCATAILLPSLVLPVGSDEADANRFAGAYLAGVVVLGLTLITAVAIFVVSTLDRPALSRSGRALAARWLGVATWLGGHGSAFTELPPAATAVWDRYLSYGAALGLTPVASRAADLAVGVRQVLWSNFSGDPSGADSTGSAGAWRPIRVHYPGRGRRPGQAPLTITVSSLLVLGLLAGLVALLRERWHLSPAGVAAVALVVSPLVGRAVYRIGRAAVDRLRPVEFTGRVLARMALPSLAGLSDLNRPPHAYGSNWLTPARQPYFVVVDDGRSAHTPVWTIYPAWRRSEQCAVGDIVRLRGYRWCRYARWLRVLKPGHATVTGTPMKSA